jgi:hypothetical protein
MATAGAHRPVSPSQPWINGKPAEADQATRSMGTVKISAIVDDPDAGQPVRLVVYYSSNNWKTQHGINGGSFVPQKSGRGVRDAVTITGLAKNTLYKARLFSQAKDSAPPYPLSIHYNSVSFWTNRIPVAELVSPAQNQEIADNQAFIFDWKFVDPDSGDKQKSFQIQYRPVSSSTWIAINPTTTANAAISYRNMAAGSLPANAHYVWRVKVQDNHGSWGGWSLEQSFFIRGLTTPPLLLDPVGGIGRGVVVTDPITFTWKFRDPEPKDRQYQADIRWRVVGAGGGDPDSDEGWFMLRGEGDAPGTSNQWVLQSGYFIPRNVYEWQVRTYDQPTRLVPSGWSASARFTAVGAPGGANDPTQAPVDASIQGELGCGTHRVFVYDRGGQRRRGEITPLVDVQWGRKRDDISNALVTSNGFGADCCELLGDLRCWMHELVIFRDGVRVFEGPITRITYQADNVQVEAKDVMVYLYRRIMREGYDDAYRRVDLNPLTTPQPLPSTKGGPYLITGNSTVVRRAAQIAINALAYEDPNVLPYLTILDHPDDAKNSRVVPDYSRTAWEEIDDLAATAGLDYVTVGRRIMLWDTHRAIGRLPEMRDGDFSDPVIVTEYGMLTANYFAVTDNDGHWGASYPVGLNSKNWFQAYGPVEMLASAFGETENDTASTETITPAALAQLVATYEKQASLNIAHRWPTPVVARVPDNSSLNPKINVGINQLIPGVWIPLRATATCRNVSQWQKLDELAVQETEGVEQVKVTLSPAPNGGDDDPDTNSADVSVD